MTTSVWPLAGMHSDDVEALLRDCDDPDDLDALIAAIEAELEWSPWPHQEPPPGLWAVWLLMGGRGCGKTDAGAYWMNAHMQGPPCDPRLPGGHRGSIVAPTLGDAAESCVTGPSGLKAHNPEVHLTSTIGGTVVRWPNGAEAKLFGGFTGNDVERFRAGGNRCCAWLEEAAAIPQLDSVWAQIPFGHRLGHNPQVFLSTTPKPRPVLKRLMESARSWRHSATIPRKRWERVIIHTATTNDNPALDEEVREGLYDLYANSRLGRQELLGELLDDYDGALWQRPALDAHRISMEALPALTRKLVGVDPSMWGIKALDNAATPPDAGEIARGIETGIVCSGMALDRHVYTLEDASGRMTPNDWANAAISTFLRWGAHGIVPETNAGGPLVIVNIQAAEAARRLEHPEMPPIVLYKKDGKYGVHASDGKRARAEPVAMLTDQGRHHMVGTLALLEDQMCGWDPNETWSPDRMDALVWSVFGLDPWGTQSRVGTSASTRRRTVVRR